MLNWEYDADTRDRVIREEAFEDGKEEGVETLAKLECIV